jgi:hypothetical protein
MNCFTEIKSIFRCVIVKIFPKKQDENSCFLFVEPSAMLLDFQ